MSSNNKPLAKIREKADFLTSQAKHQFEKWRFAAKKNTIGVSLGDTLEHKIRCLKHDAVQNMKRPIPLKKSAENPWYKDPKN